jgi:remodeling and spacing factor 1
MQFDVNAKFKNLVNAKTGAELRLEPFGRDKDGNVYYCQLDEKANIKVYQENEEEEIWSVVATNREELVKLIDELRGNKSIRPFAKDLIDEDSSSNSREAVKTDAVVEQKPAVEQEQEYSIDNSATDEFPLKQTIRLIKKPEVVEAPEAQARTSEPVAEEKTPEKGAAQKKRRRK